MNLSNAIFQIVCSKNPSETIEHLTAQADLSPEDIKALNTVLLSDSIGNWLSVDRIRQLFPPAVLESEWVPPVLPPNWGELLGVS